MKNTAPAAERAHVVGQDLALPPRVEEVLPALRLLGGLDHLGVDEDAVGDHVDRHAGAVGRERAPPAGPRSAAPRTAGRCPPRAGARWSSSRCATRRPAPCPTPARSGCARAARSPAPPAPRRGSRTSSRTRRRSWARRSAHRAAVHHDLAFLLGGVDRPSSTPHRPAAWARQASRAASGQRSEARRGAGPIGVSASLPPP